MDPLTGQRFELFTANEATRNNHALFGQYAKLSPQTQSVLDRAYSQAFKPTGAQTIEGLNGINAGALTGSDLALNDAARDYKNMRQEPQVVQWAVLGQLRQERAQNLQAQQRLLSELQGMNQRGDTSAQAAQRRGEIVNQFNLLDEENRVMRQASVEQLKAMGDAGTTNPARHREWAEGSGEAIAASRLTLQGLSAASINSRINALKGAVEEVQAASAVAKAQTNALAKLEMMRLNPGWTTSRIHDEVIAVQKGSRPLPDTYLSPSEIKEALAPFGNGVVKIKANPPSGTEGPPGGTFVMPKAQADDIIRQANGDVKMLEKLLGLRPGDLGASPVRVDIPEPKGLRLPSGNELGANEYWVPGGRTSGGIREATIDPVPKGEYSIKKVF